MAETATQSIPVIRDLIAFPTVSRNPNRDLLDYVGAFLKKHGVAYDILWNEDGRKGNLWATIGPADRRGVILSGHSDVTAGAVVGARDALDRLWEALIVYGMTLHPMESWLLSRGLQTFPIRMDLITPRARHLGSEQWHRVPN